MLRENNTCEGIIKEFNNHNMSAKLHKSIIEDIKAGHMSEFEALVFLFDSLDSYFLCDDYCLGNDCLGTSIYNAHSDRIYIMSYNDIYNVLLQGKTLKLYARVPDEDDRELLEDRF